MCQARVAVVNLALVVIRDRIAVVFDLREFIFCSITCLHRVIAFHVLTI